MEQEEADRLDEAPAGPQRTVLDRGPRRPDASHRADGPTARVHARGRDPGGWLFDRPT